MISHLSLGVADLERAIAFYDPVLAALGYARVYTGPVSVGYGPSGAEDKLALKLQSEGVVPLGPGYHLAFTAASHEAVDHFHATALRHGGSDGGAPGPRPHYGPNYYAGFVFDPDGHKLEAVCHRPAQAGPIEEKAMHRISSVNEAGIYEPFAAEEAPVEEFSKGERYACRYRRLGHFGGGSHVGVVLEELPAGRQSNMPHYHLLEEEHVYILEGTLTVHLGERAYIVAAGDYVCFPAGQKVGHFLLNHSDAPCRYLLIGEDNPHDVAVFPESGRVSVRLTAEGYRKSATMEYWEGQE
jgi:uncharacterized cupin superfamily protein/catechol 2,3-dioxygenase-like lactoylglutathione lyase family enzyme